MKGIPPKGAIPPAVPRRRGAGSSSRPATLSAGQRGRARNFPIRTWTFEEKPTFRRLRTKLHVKRVHQPDVDVHDEVSQLVIIANLPGAVQKDLNIEVHGDIMSIEATRRHDSGQVHHYHRELLLPVEVEDVPTDVTYGNGLLEVRLKPKTAQQEKRGVPARRRQKGRDAPSATRHTKGGRP